MISPLCSTATTRPSARRQTFFESMRDSRIGWWMAVVSSSYAQGALRLARAVGLGHAASNPESFPELYDRLESGIVASANLGMDHGLYGPKANPTLREARMLLLARKQQAEQELDEDMRRGLGGMSLSMSVNEDVKKIFQGDVNRRVALQLGQTMEAAREAQAKNTAVHNQAVTSAGARRSDKSGT